MRKLTATLCLTIAVLLGSVGMSAGADFQKRVLLHLRVEITQLLCVNGNLLLNRGMPVVGE
jgi:hypothetical protein